MKSIYFNEEKEVKIEEIKEAANGIKEGKLVLFPTETVHSVRRGVQQQARISAITWYLRMRKTSCRVQ